MLVPFGARKLTGVVLALHERAARRIAVKDVLRLIDEQPVLDCELLALGRWIAAYYCAPLGEVLRSMTPLTGEMRKSKMYALTDAGRDAARQLLLTAGERIRRFRCCSCWKAGPLSATYLKKKIPKLRTSSALCKRRASSKIEDIASRSRSVARLRRTPPRGPGSHATRRTATKLTKAERELLAYLDLHPGSHNLAEAWRRR